MISPEPVRPIQYTEETKDKILELLGNIDGLNVAILGMEKVLRRNPENEETRPIEGYPNMRIFARRAKGNPEVPAVTLLYEYNSERILVWDIRVE